MRGDLHAEALRESRAWPGQPNPQAALPGNSYGPRKESRQGGPHGSGGNAAIDAKEVAIRKHRLGRGYRGGMWRMLWASTAGDLSPRKAGRIRQSRNRKVRQQESEGTIRATRLGNAG